MPDILLDRVSRQYGDVLALHEIDLAVLDREFLVVVGPSGSGKTTILRIVAGLDKPTSGHVHIGGLVVDHVPASKRGVAMLSQEMALYPHLTVRGNLEFPLKVRHQADEEIATRVDAIAGELRLTRLLGKRPGEMSVGQRQAVATGRAVVAAPSLVLLDEPFAQVDAGARRRLRTELRNLRELQAATVIMATNDQEVAMALADRIAVLSFGRLQQVASPREVYRRPVNTFVAGFVGSINLMRGRILDAAPLMVRLGRRSIPVPDREDAAVVPGSDVIVGVRPEALHYGATGMSGGPEHRLGGTVVRVEQLGTHQIVRLASDITASHGDGPAELAARLPADVAVEIGSHLALTFDPARLLLFDVAGRALQ